MVDDNQQGQPNNNPAPASDSPQADGRDAQQQQQPGSPIEIDGEVIRDPAGMIRALMQRVSERDDQLRAQREAQRTAAEQNGEYERLYREAQAQIEQLMPQAQRAQTLIEMIQQQNEQRVQQIPDHMRDLVPTDYSPERLQDWLNRNQSRLNPVAAPDTAAGQGDPAPARDDVQLTDAERNIAKRMGISTEAYIAIRRRNQKTQQ